MDLSPASTDHSVNNTTQTQTWRDAWDVLLILGAFAVIRAWAQRWMILEESDYAQPVIIVREFQHLPTLAWYGSSFLAAWFRGREFVWSNWDGGKVVRGFVVLVAVTAASAFGLYQYNFYFGQWHLVDRFLLFAMAYGVWRHPLWSGPFLAHCLSMLHQFRYPLLDYTWSHNQALVSVLYLISATMFISLFRRQPMTRFFWLALCITGANYFWAGWQKLMIGWPWHEDLSALFVSCYMQGWARWWSEAQVATIDQWLEVFSPLLVGFTLLVEVGALLLATRRSLAIAVLLGCTGLHIGIFALTGICFWKWCMVNLGLLMVLCLGSKETLRAIFPPSSGIAASLAVILVAPWYAHVVDYSWYDTPLTHQFDFELVGKSGRRYRLTSGDFAPYELTVSQNKFGYLSPDPIAVGPMGVANELEMAVAAAEVKTPADLQELMEEFGTVDFDPQRDDEMGQFLCRYLDEVEQGPSLLSDWELLPHCIWSSEPGNAYFGQEPLVEIRAIRRDVVWDEALGHEVLLRESLLARWSPETGKRLDTGEGK